MFNYLCLKNCFIMINEIFDIKSGKMQKKDGTTVDIIYIDPKTSENTYQYKDKIKSEFGGVWLTTMKTWGWFAGRNPQETVNTKVKPCLEFLTSVETTDNGEKRDVMEIINRILADLQGENLIVPNAGPSSLNADDSKKLEEKLLSFKAELMKLMNPDDIKKRLEPILNFRYNKGHEYSFVNALLIMVQDPQATLVKSMTRWAKYFNRDVIPNSPAIWVWRPNGKHAVSSEQKEIIKNKFIEKIGKKSYEELTPGQKEELSIKLNSAGFVSGFKFSPVYDVRFTKQMEGKDDLVAKMNDAEKEFTNQWTDNESEETEDTKKYCEATIQVIKGSGIDFAIVDEGMNGAMGYSSNSGKIRIQDRQRNAGFFGTLVHEFAHALLHQTFLKNNNPELQEYFLGREEGDERIEQQAELTSWIVLKNFGYDIRQSINYVACWGLNDKNCAYVFDQVSKTATFIVNSINKKLGNDELYENVNGGAFLPTGKDLAKMFGGKKGLEKYVRGEEELNKEMAQTLNEVKKSFWKTYKSINPTDMKQVNEAVSKRSAINKIYKATKDITSKLYSDDSWNGVDLVGKAIENLGYSCRLMVENGGYRNSLGGNTLFVYNPDVAYWKEYKVEVTTDDGIVINGYLNCHLCGTTEDPFEKYDMSLVLW